MIKKYNDFLNINEDLNNLPKEILDSSLIIIKGIFDKVKKISFYEKDNNFFIKFQINSLDFNFIDSDIVLPLDLSINFMKKKEYYVELEFIDKILNDNQVIYKINYTKMTPDRYSNIENNIFIDNYEEELKKDIEDYNNDDDIEDFVQF